MPLTYRSWLVHLWCNQLLHAVCGWRHSNELIWQECRIGRDIVSGQAKWPKTAHNAWPVIHRLRPSRETNNFIVADELKPVDSTPGTDISDGKLSALQNASNQHLDIGCCWCEMHAVLWTSTVTGKWFRYLSFHLNEAMTHHMRTMLLSSSRLRCLLTVINQTSFRQLREIINHVYNTTMSRQRAL